MKINLKACMLALAVAITPVYAKAATTEQIAFCKSIEDVAFVVMNARQNLIKKEVLLNDPDTTVGVAKIIERAYALPEVEVPEIAFAVRDFSYTEQERCIKQFAF